MTMIEVYSERLALMMGQGLIRFEQIGNLLSVVLRFSYTSKLYAGNRNNLKSAGVKNGLRLLSRMTVSAGAFFWG